MVVLARREVLRLQRTQPFVDALIRHDGNTYRQGVDEQSQHGLRAWLAVGPASHRSAEQRARLARLHRQPHRPCPLHQRVGRHAHAFGGQHQHGGLCFVQRQPQSACSRFGLRRTAPGRREPRRRIDIGQQVLPIAAGLLHRAPGEPGDVIAIAPCRGSAGFTAVSAQHVAQ
ncbi:hypothetical protein D3C72_1878890 [compost metagenome]